MYKKKTVSNKLKTCGKKQLRMIFFTLVFTCVSLFVLQRYKRLSEINELIANKSLPGDTASGNVPAQDSVPLDPVSRAVYYLHGDVKDPRDKIWNEKREAVKKAFAHSWNAYEKYAMGFDEFQPQSKQGKNMFGGLGATIIDSIDTAFIMGNMEAYNKIREWIADNFKPAKSYDASVFETTIRCLGGLISAYDLTEDKMFLNKAVELADRLLPAFNTPTGLSYGSVNLLTGTTRNPSWTGRSSILAEFGTVQLELFSLSHRTGDKKYFEAGQKIIDYMDSNMPPNHLYPLFYDPNSGQPTTSQISFGAMGDSFYEYLIKVAIYLKKDPVAASQYSRMFHLTMKGMMDELVAKTEASSYIYIGESKNGRFQKKMDHLACFAAGMLILGVESAPEESKREYLRVAEGIAETCWRTYNMTQTGLGPEYVVFDPKPGVDIEPGARHNLLRPETIEALFYVYRATRNETYREWGWMMFQAFEKYCKDPEGYSGVRDVTVVPPAKDNTMQSFFLAETLKYFYLLFSPNSEIPLDEWVFNTEAHPVRIWRT